MEILYLMVPLGLVLVALGLWAFFWAVGSGQFDDLDSPGWSVLDDEKKKTPRDQTASSDDPARKGDTKEESQS
jgi:cbb3-type cytochrome oxidase maturation protein